MHNQDWSLVFFTTLSQLSVGIILCFSIIHYYSADGSLMVAKGLSLKNPVLLALVFIGLATFISLMHLGSPLKAPNSLSNLKGSWVSREILGLGLFAFCSLVVFILGWKLESSSVYKYLLPISTIIGLTFIWFMIRIYNIPTIPAWSHWNTPVSFTSTAVLLGILTVLILKFNGYLEISDLLTKRFINALLIILIIELCVGFMHQLRIESLNAGIDDLVFNQGPFYTLFILRMSLILIAIAGLSLSIFKPSLFPGNGYYVLMYLMFFGMIIQEFMGRLLFFASYFRVGV